MSKMLHVRTATLADAEGLARVQVHAWQKAYRGIFPDEVLDGFEVGQRTRHFAKRLGNPEYPNDRDWLCERNGEIVGWICWMPSRDEDADSERVAEVTAVYVHPSAWGIGAGTMLMERIHDHITDLGTFRETTLWVLEENPRARRIYERHGYRVDGSRKGLLEFPQIMEVRYRRPTRRRG